MFVEINSTLINVQKIDFVGQVYGGWFRWACNGHEFNWSAEFHDPLIQVVKDSFPQ